MAIDVLTAEGRIPIIVGDEDAVDMVVGLDWPDEAGVACLVLRDSDGNAVRCELPVGVSKVINGMDHAAIVAMGDDEIAYARMVSRDGRLAQRLDPPQLSILTEMMVRQDWTLTLIR